MAIPVEERPPAGRVLIGFLVAAFAAVTVFMIMVVINSGEESSAGAVLGLIIFGLLFGIPIAGMAILILALPAYLLLRTRWHVRWWNAALAGFLVAMAPGVLLGGGTSLEALGVGLAGLVGGLAFWGIVRGRRAHPRIDAETFR